MACKKMPDDVRGICILLVRGYDRRVHKYHERRREIIEGSACQYEVIKDKEDPDNWQKSSYYYPPSAHNASRTDEDKAVQLMGLEELPETKRMRAVEQAKMQIGLDLSEDMREKLTEAILLNCTSGRRYPYERLDVEGIGKTDFYDRRTLFLIEIARFLKLL